MLVHTTENFPARGKLGHLASYAFTDVLLAVVIHDGR